jgi:hypothetical protein
MDTAVTEEDDTVPTRGRRDRDHEGLEAAYAPPDRGSRLADNLTMLAAVVIVGLATVVVVVALIVG